MRATQPARAVGSTQRCQRVPGRAPRALERGGLLRRVWVLPVKLSPGPGSLEKELAWITGPLVSDPAGLGGPRSLVLARSQGHGCHSHRSGAPQCCALRTPGSAHCPTLASPHLFSAALGRSFLGKAQLYLPVSRAPQDVACQVQPHRGLEADTVFSIFCMSGRPVRTAARVCPEGEVSAGSLMKRWACKVSPGGQVPGLSLWTALWLLSLSCRLLPQKPPVRPGEAPPPLPCRPAHRPCSEAETGPHKCPVPPAVSPTGK